MNKFLRISVTIAGVALLGQSIVWSKNGFGLDFKTTSDTVVFVGYLLAIVASLLQFVFSTDFVDLNPTLVFLGIVAYVYSIYTNILGISEIQVDGANPFMRVVLAILIDMSPELMISWGLGESRSGDALTTIFKSFLDDSFPNKNKHNKSNRSKSSSSRSSNKHTYKGTPKSKSRSTHRRARG